MEMLNSRPIFINAFARGGSNILMNLLLSHPDVCLSAGETSKVFKGTKWDPLWRKIKKRVCYDFPIRLVTGQDYFSPFLLETRKQVPGFLKRYIDSILYYGRFTAMIDTHNLYKFENIPYSKEELVRCRLLTKGLNGIACTVDLFRDMYPDAVFLGLVRNGLSICEGYVRRGHSAESIAEIYRSVVQRMLKSNAEMSNYHLLYYEDMVKNPLEFMHMTYNLVELDIKKVRKVRLQSKKIMNAEGSRSRLEGRDRQVFWHEPSQLHKHIKQDVNENQIRQLSENDKARFLSIAGDVMEELGYMHNDKNVQVHDT